MFGFFKKKDGAAPPPRQAKEPFPDDGNPVHRAITGFNPGNPLTLFALFDALAASSVTLRVAQPGQMQSCMQLDFQGASYIAVFTLKEFAEAAPAPDHPHLMEVPVRQLCLAIGSDTVGMVINPLHPGLHSAMHPKLFKVLREKIRSSQPILKEGGIYHVVNDDKTFSVLKILKLDEGGVHIRQYSNQYPVPPFSVDESTLYMAGMDRAPGVKLGMGHLPISKNAFAGWGATFVQQGTVPDEELEGYKMWLEAKGGYF